MVKFLNKELTIPTNVNGELVSEVRSMIEGYECQLIQIGKDFEVCIDEPESYNNANCLDIIKRIGVKSEDAF